MSINIESGFPVPPSNQARLTEESKALMNMKHGESILTDLSRWNTLISCARRKGFKIRYRTVGDKIRVWKITEGGAE